MILPELPPRGPSADQAPADGWERLLADVAGPSTSVTPLIAALSRPLSAEQLLAIDDVLGAGGAAPSGDRTRVFSRCWRSTARWRSTE